MLPFTQEEFFQVFRQYNSAFWPAAWVAYGAAALSLYLVMSRNRFAGPVMAATLAVMWTWTGIAYHYLHFSRINGAALLFAALFLMGSAVFAFVGLWKNDFRFDGPWTMRNAAGWLLMAYAAIAYPLLGLAAGHSWAELPLFGITPCPVTLFTFGAILLLRPPMSRLLLVMPLIWSLIGGTAAFLLQVPQDWPLLFAGVATVLLVALSGGFRREAAGAANK